VKHNKEILLVSIFVCVLALVVGGLPALAQPFAYVTNYAAGNVSVIDTATNTVVATVTVGNMPIAVAITPNGAFAYVTNFTEGSVSVIDTAINRRSDPALASGSDSRGPSVVATVTVGIGLGPLGVAITPDGDSAYVANSVSDSISVIDTETNTVPTTVLLALGSGPMGVAITPPAASCHEDDHEKGNGGSDGRSHSCKRSGKED